MRTLLLTSSFPPILGGLERYVLEVAGALSTTDLHVAAPRAPGDHEIDRTLPFRVHRYDKATAYRRGPAAAFRGLVSGLDAIDGRGRRWGISPRTTWLALVNRTMIRHAAAQCLAGRGMPPLSRPDLVLAGSALPSGLVALLLHERAGIPFVVFTHGAELLRWQRPRRLAWLLARVLQRASAVGAVSRFTADVVTGLGVDPAAVHLVPPGIDAMSFAGGAAIEATRRRLGLGDRAVILTHGRLDDRKGHDVVLEALPMVQARAGSTVYLVTGSGPAEERLRRRARELGLDGDVIFAGPASSEELAALYGACDVFVMASRRIGDNVEGFGIVCLEAAAAGKPVVAGRSGGVPDAVVDGVTGLLADPESPADVAEKIVALLLDPARRVAMGEAGRQRVAREFDRRSFRARIEDLVADALAGRRGSPTGAGRDA